MSNMEMETETVWVSTAALEKSMRTASTPDKHTECLWLPRRIRSLVAFSGSVLSHTVIILGRRNLSHLSYSVHVSQRPVVIVYLQS